MKNKKNHIKYLIAILLSTSIVTYNHSAFHTNPRKKSSIFNALKKTDKKESPKISVADFNKKLKIVEGLALFKESEKDNEQVSKTVTNIINALQALKGPIEFSHSFVNGLAKLLLEPTSIKSVTSNALSPERKALVESIIALLTSEEFKKNSLSNMDDIATNFKLNSQVQSICKKFVDITTEADKGKITQAIADAIYQKIKEQFTAAITSTLNKAKCLTPASFTRPNNNGFTSEATAKAVQEYNPLPKGPTTVTQQATLRSAVTGVLNTKIISSVELQELLDLIKNNKPFIQINKCINRLKKAPSIPSGNNSLILEENAKLTEEAIKSYNYSPLISLQANLSKVVDDALKTKIISPVEFQKLLELIKNNQLFADINTYIKTLGDYSTIVDCNTGVTPEEIANFNELFNKMSPEHKIIIMNKTQGLSLDKCELNSPQAQALLECLRKTYSLLTLLEQSKEKLLEIVVAANITKEQPANAILSHLLEAWYGDRDKNVKLDETIMEHIHTLSKEIQKATKKDAQGNFTNKFEHTCLKYLFSANTSDTIVDMSETLTDISVLQLIEDGFLQKMFEHTSVEDEKKNKNFHGYITQLLTNKDIENPQGLVNGLIDKLEYYSNKESAKFIQSTKISVKNKNILEYITLLKKRYDGVEVSALEGFVELNLDHLERPAAIDSIVGIHVWDYDKATTQETKSIIDFKILDKNNQEASMKLSIDTNNILYSMLNNGITIATINAEEPVEEAKCISKVSTFFPKSSKEDLLDMLYTAYSNPKVYGKKSFIGKVKHPGKNIHILFAIEHKSEATIVPSIVTAYPLMHFKETNPLFIKDIKAFDLIKFEDLKNLKDTDKETYNKYILDAINEQDLEYQEKLINLICSDIALQLIAEYGRDKETYVALENFKEFTEENNKKLTEVKNEKIIGLILNAPEKAIVELKKEFDTYTKSKEDLEKALTQSEILGSDYAVINKLNELIQNRWGNAKTKETLIRFATLLNPSSTRSIVTYFISNKKNTKASSTILVACCSFQAGTGSGQDIQDRLKELGEDKYDLKKIGSEFFYLPIKKDRIIKAIENLLN
jgi:hypothetical protein